MKLTVPATSGRLRWERCDKDNNLLDRRAAIIFHDLGVAFAGSDDVLHWPAWNISAKAGGIPEGGLLPEGTVSGTAGVGRGNYFGPGAPAGPRYHHYVFELYALSKMLDLPVDATRAQLDAMKDAIVGKAAYVGRFRQ